MKYPPTPHPLEQPLRDGIVREWVLWSTCADCRVRTPMQADALMARFWRHVDRSTREIAARAVSGACGSRRVGPSWLGNGNSGLSYRMARTLAVPAAAAAAPAFRRGFH